jgi:glutaredoxin
MQAVDGYNKLPIEKREVYFDKENAAKMSIDSAKLGLESVGVPFLIINENSEETPLV